LGFDGCSLISDLVLLLGGPELVVHLSSVGSHLLLLLRHLLLLGGMVPGCVEVVCNRTVRTVRSVIVLSDGGVGAMKTIGVTMLHPRGTGSLELAHLPDAA
jgi:hypothetical protein